MIKKTIKREQKLERIKLSNKELSQILGGRTVKTKPPKQSDDAIVILSSSFKRMW